MKMTLHGFVIDEMKTSGMNDGLKTTDGCAREHDDVVRVVAFIV